MKKNYIQPAFEVMAVNTAYNVCQAVSYTENFNGTPIPADPSEGR